MKILYITQTFPPEPGSTQRPLKQAICLQELGHQLTILTTMPYYPLGRVFKGYRGKLLIREKVDGIDTIRVWSIPASNKGKIRRIISRISFAMAALIITFRVTKPDLIIASVPHIGTEAASVLAAFLKRCKVLLELRDVVPDNLIFIGITRKSLLVRIFKTYFKLIYRCVDLIAVPGENMIDILKQRGVSSDRILLLPHAADLAELESSDGRKIRQKFKLQTKFVVVYAGSFSRYYDIPNLVASAFQLKDRLPQIHLLLLGIGPDVKIVEKMIKENRIDNVTLAGFVPPSKVGDYLQAADLFITSLVGKAMPDFYKGHLTTKVCEYLMVGRPVIAVESDIVLGDFLKEINAGFSVPSSQPEALASAIAFYATRPNETVQCGDNARAYALAYLDRKSVVKKFESELVKKLHSFGMKSK